MFASVGCFNDFAPSDVMPCYAEFIGCFVALKGAAFFACTDVRDTDINRGDKKTGLC
jgi:hypothetical protein